jgi:GDP-L-fucose synthase
MKIYIAGINGMVGSAISRAALAKGYEVFGKSSKELDFRNRDATFSELASVRPDILIIAAAKVGGIGANSELPVDFLSINLQLQTNLMDAAHEAKISKVIFLSSSCIYPRLAPQPITEKSLLTSELEPTNEAYAIAKIAGLKLIDSYRKQFGHDWLSVMPTNLYGPGDNFDLKSAHVLPALINKFHLAKSENLPSVEIWGDGSALREFLHVDDLANAVVLLISANQSNSLINIGSGEELSILDLATLISECLEFDGTITFDKTKPNGTPRKLLDSSIMRNLGWKASINLKEGISKTYDLYRGANLEGITK